MTSPSEFVWGVVDFFPDTDFPDIRARTVIHSIHGSILVVPREGDLVRLYVQLSDVDLKLVDKQTNRVDKGQASPEKLIETAAKILQPYYLRAFGDVQWWTVYISVFISRFFEALIDESYSRSTSR